jgi:hypothetical protein
VIARIDTTDEKNKKVTFFSRQPLKSPNTFVVNDGDEVIWNLQNATGGDLQNGVISIKVVAFPAGCKPLFKAGDTLTAQGNEIRGSISPDAAGGLYLYQLLLGPETLACLWANPGGNPEETVGAGGHKSPPPPN